MLPPASITARFIDLDSVAVRARVLKWTSDENKPQACKSVARAARYSFVDFHLSCSGFSVPVLFCFSYFSRKTEIDIAFSPDDRPAPKEALLFGPKSHQTARMSAGLIFVDRRALKFILKKRAR
jgi:hypothetical protein